MDGRGVLLLRAGLYINLLLICVHANGNINTHRVHHKPHSSNFEEVGYDRDYVSDWSPAMPDWAMLSGRVTPAKCIDIPSNLTLCHSIGYTQMRLPNLLEHDSLSEVTSQAASWVPLLNIQCHPNTQLFLCSLFSPVCLERKIYPCQNLCEAVKAGCAERMKKYGYPWPEMLRCDKFPKNNDLCIDMQEQDKEKENLCKACNQATTFENIVDNYCQADFVLKMKVKENVVVGEDAKLVALKKKKKYKKGSLTKADLRSLTVYVPGGRKCECPVVGTRNKNSFYLVMGKKVNGKLMASFVQVFDKKNKQMRKGLRGAQKQNLCKAGVEAITGKKKKVPTATLR